VDKITPSCGQFRSTLSYADMILTSRAACSAAATICPRPCKWWLYSHPELSARRSPRTRIIVLHPCTKFEVRRPTRSEDMADFLVTTLIGLVTLTFRLSSYQWGHGSPVSCVISFLPIFSFLCPSSSRPRVRHGTDRRTDRRQPSTLNAPAR